MNKIVASALLAVASQAYAGTPDLLLPPPSDRANTTPAGGALGGYPSEGTVTITPPTTEPPIGSVISFHGQTWELMKISVPAYATDTRTFVTLPVYATGLTLSSVAPEFSVGGGFAAFTSPMVLTPGTAALSLGPGTQFSFTADTVPVTCTEGYVYSGFGVELLYQYVAQCAAVVDPLTQVTFPIAFGIQYGNGGLSCANGDCTASDPYAVTPSSTQRRLYHSELLTLLGYLQFSPGH